MGQSGGRRVDDILRVVHKVSILTYILLGGRFQYLETCKQQNKLFGHEHVLHNLERLLSEFSDAGLPVTRRAAARLTHLLHEMDPDSLRNDTDHQSDKSIGVENSKKLRDTMEQLRLTMHAEALAVFTHEIPARRISTEILLDSIQEMFRPTMFSKLPSIARYDVSEAGKCIAFGRATAAAFHTVRAVEAVLKDYHAYFIPSTKWPKTRMWGNMTKQLEERLATRARKQADPKVLASLDHIRLHYRNPTAHPSSIYDIHESEELFHLVVDVVGRMGTAAYA